MNKRLAEAAAVPVVTEAVGKAWRLRGGLATGWPVLAWVAKFKPDSLRRLHLDRLGAGRKQKEIEPSRVGRTSLPDTSGVQKARVDTAIRALADETADGLNRGWADAIKRAARASEGILPDALTGRSRRLIWTWRRTARGGRRYEYCSGSCWLAWSVASPGSAQPSSWRTCSCRRCPTSPGGVFRPPC